MEGYVRQAVMSTFLDGYRRRVRWAGVRTLVSADVRDRSGRDCAMATATQVDVRAALAGLSPRERACVVLRHLDALPVAETAEVLGGAPGRSSGIRAGIQDAAVEAGGPTLNMRTLNHGRDLDL